MTINEEVLANMAMLSSAENDNEKLAIMAQTSDLLSEKVEHMYGCLRNLQSLFRGNVTTYTPDGLFKDQLLKLDFVKEVDDYKSVL